MAREITCDLCGNEPAMALYSTLADGTTLAIGDQCAPNFVVGLAIAVGVLPDPTQEPAEESKPAAKGRRKRADVEPETATEAAEPVAEESVAAE